MICINSNRNTDSMVAILFLLSIVLRKSVFVFGILCTISPNSLFVVMMFNLKSCCRLRPLAHLCCDWLLFPEVLTFRSSQSVLFLSFWIFVIIQWKNKKKNQTRNIFFAEQIRGRSVWNSLNHGSPRPGSANI